MTWTTEDIPDHTGRTAVVTGANSGLGSIAARELAKAGADVVLACRNIAKGEEVAAEIRSQAPGSGVEMARLDLADLSSVHSFAEELGHERLDLLVNNAGLMAVPRQLTEDGFEMQIGVNHLGHFALTGLLLQRLERAPEPRVVTVTSSAHRAVKGINFDDINGDKRYFPGLRTGSPSSPTCSSRSSFSAAPRPRARRFARWPRTPATPPRTSRPAGAATDCSRVPRTR